jgi:hypothetical protein
MNCVNATCSHWPPRSSLKWSLWKHPVWLTTSSVQRSFPKPINVLQVSSRLAASQMGRQTRIQRNGAQTKR